MSIAALSGWTSSRTPGPLSPTSSGLSALPARPACLVLAVSRCTPGRRGVPSPEQGWERRDVYRRSRVC